MISLRSMFCEQICDMEDSDNLTRERREHRVFNVLLQMIPGLQDRLVEASAEEMVHIGDLVCHVLDPGHDRA